MVCVRKCLGCICEMGRLHTKSHLLRDAAPTADLKPMWANP